MSETNVTTHIIVTVRRSTRKPTCRRQPSPCSQVYTDWSMEAPFFTCRKQATDAANESATDRIALQCAKARPSFQPRKPARAAPTRGAKAAMQERVNRSIVFSCPSWSGARGRPGALALQGVEVVHVDGAQVAEERHEDRQADRRFGGGDGQDEEDEHLARDVVQVAREGDEVHVHREQHELDRHEQHDEVLAVHEDADDAHREEHGGEQEVVVERDHFAASRGASTGTSVSEGSFTILRRSFTRTESWVAASWNLVSLRRRSVSAIAATIATRSTTAASSNGYT